ncbi:MAG: substrate-binding domain-containing protein [Spirochaetes bacterium]|nr:substrate-binding domain-containing protein [Spirochaetota bacterium]
MSVMGYDDTLDAEMTFPALTTVRQPIEKMGEWAMEMLLNKDHKESIILQHSIAERNSVADA